MTSQVYKDLSKPFSGNKVTRFGDKIVKIGPTTRREYIWMMNMIHQPFTPNIISFSGDKLILEFIESEGSPSVDGICDILDTFSGSEPLGNFGFDDYLHRIKDHLSKNPIFGSYRLIDKLKTLSIEPTFSHGDFSIDNILQSKDGIKLIDPLSGHDRFGSYLIDAAKLAFSLKFYYFRWQDYNMIMERFKIPEILIASECVRVATYNRNFNFIAENLIREL